MTSRNTVPTSKAYRIISIPSQIPCDVAKVVSMQALNSRLVGVRNVWFRCRMDRREGTQQCLEGPKAFS